LKQQVIDTLGSILQSIIDKAVDHWTAVLRACVEANGHHFEIWTSAVSNHKNRPQKQALFRTTHSLLRKTHCTSHV